MLALPRSLVVVGDTAGPTTVPGIPTLEVGGNATLVPLGLDGQGKASLSFTAPSAPAMRGAFWYGQVVSFDAAGQIVVSNPTINLFE